MNIAPFLAKACQELDKAMQGTLDGTKIACISETISGYAIAAAIASGVAGVAPGFAGVAAALTQAGFVWATYVKINKTLDISMSEKHGKVHRLCHRHKLDNKCRCFCCRAHWFVNRFHYPWCPSRFCSYERRPWLYHCICLCYHLP